MIDQLFDGPLDIIGDVHGEINALRLLLWHLGYDQLGNHPDGRRLVFLGDLVDRGPDSPAVVELVMRLVDSGKAQCILGNHELNLIRGERKDGNDWFTHPEEPGEYPFKAVDEQQKPRFIEFLLDLPLVLERADLRVVHACWDSESIRRLAKLNESHNALEAYGRFESELNLGYVPQTMIESELNPILKEKNSKPPFMPDLARYETDYQMGNPVRVLTSGEEAPAAEPFWAGGKWRMVERIKWWDNYEDSIPVIVGHYWRHFDKVSEKLTDKDGPDLFAGIEPYHWMGKHKNVYCVDFSVGARHRARAKKEPKHMFKLVAVRWSGSESLVMYDDGTSHHLQ